MADRTETGVGRAEWCPIHWWDELEIMWQAQEKARKDGEQQSPAAGGSIVCDDEGGGSDSWDQVLSVSRGRDSDLLF